MRTSLNEIEEIENWLFERGDAADNLVVEAKIIVNQTFREKVCFQLETYDVIQQYGREKLKKEVKEVEAELFQSSKHETFQKQINAIFKI